MTYALEDVRIPKRIWDKIAESESGCWEFTGALAHGYGITSLGGRRTRVHRLTWEALVGPIPEGLVIDHLCRNKACCNPAHLEPVTQRENVLRGESPMALNAKKTHCSKGHELTPENCLRKYLPARRCRTCSLKSYLSFVYQDEDDW